LPKTRDYRPWKGVFSIEVTKKRKVLCKEIFNYSLLEKKFWGLLTHFKSTEHGCASPHCYREESVRFKTVCTDKKGKFLLLLSRASSLFPNFWLCFENLNNPLLLYVYIVQASME
jgi:hypothetical protein